MVYKYDNLGRQKCYNVIILIGNWGVLSRKSDSLSSSLHIFYEPESESEIMYLVEHLSRPRNHVVSCCCLNFVHLLLLFSEYMLFPPRLLLPRTISVVLLLLY